MHETIEQALRNGDYSMLQDAFDNLFARIDDLEGRIAKLEPEPEPDKEN